MEENKKEESLESISKSIENFTVDFHKSVAAKIDGNFVSSALSAHAVLSMAAYGAEGMTKNEMRQALHLPGNDQLALQEFQAFIDILNTVEIVTINVANKIYAANRIKINEKYKQITSTYFRSKSGTLDFSKNVESAKEINKWCAEQTDGKIADIINEDMLSATTAMVLLNAIYFKGNSKHKFTKSETEIKPFHINKATSIEVPTMIISKYFYYLELKDINAEIVKLPYENEDFCMLIIVPTEIDGLQNLEKNLEKINFDFDRTKKIRLSLPRFKVETRIDLNSHLEELGMVAMFSNKANFNGISKGVLKVDQVIQKAFIDVNEEGTEAAADDGFRCRLMKRKIPPRNVTVDRPFLYKIVHKNCTLFMGRLVNPLET